MGAIVLVVRLVLADVRRHQVQAVLLLLAVTVATARWHWACPCAA
ncbi:hypothetical protein [Nonomuraea sp. B19D2]